MSDTIPLNEEPALVLSDDHCFYLDGVCIGYMITDTDQDQVNKTRAHLSAGHRALQAMELFCRRCELGQVRSTATYNSFLHILREVGLR